jgi:hypothetical protein
MATARDHLSPGRGRAEVGLAGRASRTTSAFAAAARGNPAWPPFSSAATTITCPTSGSGSWPAWNGTRVTS